MALFQETFPSLLWDPRSIHPQCFKGRRETKWLWLVFKASFTIILYHLFYEIESERHLILSTIAIAHWDGILKSKDKIHHTIKKKLFPLKKYIYIYTHISFRKATCFFSPWSLPGSHQLQGCSYHRKGWWKLHRLGRFFGEGNGTTLQYCCLENPMDSDGGAW